MVFQYQYSGCFFLGSRDTEDCSDHTKVNAGLCQQLHKKNYWWLVHKIITVLFCKTSVRFHVCQTSLRSQQAISLQNCCCFHVLSTQYMEFYMNLFSTGCRFNHAIHGLYYIRSHCWHRFNCISNQIHRSVFLLSIQTYTRTTAQ